MGRLEQSEQRKKFAAEYLIDFNGKQAAIRAGFSKRSAAQIGYKLLNRDDVQKILREGIKSHLSRTEILADEVLKTIKDVADADPNALVEMRRGCCRYCHGDGGDYQHTKQEWARKLEDWEKAKATYDLRAPSDKVGFFPPLDVKGGIGFNPNQKPNPACTECFGEGEVRSFINDSRELTPAARKLFAGVKETANGIELKVNSQDGARKMLAEHAGLLVRRLGNADGSNLPIPSNPAPMHVKFKSAVKTGA